MEDMTIFNLRVVNKGALKATVSIRLGNGFTIHDCKIIQQDGALSAALPQRAERQTGGEVVYHDLGMVIKLRAHRFGSGPPFSGTLVTT